MFCIECGFKNPDHAKFCAKCGSKLPVLEEEPVKPVEEGPVETELVEKPAPVRIRKPLPEAEDAAPAKRRRASDADGDGETVPPKKAPDPEDGDRDAPFRRPVPEEQTAPISRRERRLEVERRMTVEPLAENPAQPKQMEWESAEQRMKKTLVIPEPEKEAEEPEEIEDVKPVQKPHTVITSAGETVPEPKRLSAQQERKNTMVPKRNPLTGFDAFLDEAQDGDEEDEGEKESFFERHLRSIITLIMLAIAVLAVVLLLASPIGRKFCYENKLPMMSGVTAATYEKWGDGYMDDNRYSDAARAYLNAWALDDGNFDLCLKMADSSALSGDYDQAYKAVKICMGLDAGQKAPYQKLKEFYPNLPGNYKAEAADILSAGAENFGDASLLTD